MLSLHIESTDFMIQIHTHRNTQTHTQSHHTHTHTQSHYTHTNTHMYIHTHKHTHTHTHHRMQLHRMNHKTSPPLTSTGKPHSLQTQLLSTSNCHWRLSFGRDCSYPNLEPSNSVHGELGCLFSYRLGLLWWCRD